MDSEFNWVIVEVDGKIASVSPDFKLFADIAARIAGQNVDAVSEIRCRKATTREVVELSRTLRWEDLAPYGSKFQKHVWHTLFDLTHNPDNQPVQTTQSAGVTQDTAVAPVDIEIVPDDWAARPAEVPKAVESDHRTGSPFAHLLSYTDFARLCGNEPGARAVAHAVAVNPIAVIVPCHLIVPKETIDRIRRIELQVAPTLFSNFLLATSDINFGEYRYGPALKRSLIIGSF